MVYYEMKKERFRSCKTFLTINFAVSRPSWTTLSMLVSQLGVKRELASLILSQEVS
jgi:hypothetical protein